MTSKSGLVLAASLMLLAACGERDVILTGERFDIRPDTTSVANQSRPVNFASAVANSEWTHRNGAPSHTMRHPALGTSLTPLFAVEIGEGDSRRARITADPVIAGGIIYTMDARARVSATSTSGQAVWAVDLTPGSDGVNDASGGGLAVAGGQVFATSGFGELTVLDAGSGQEIWTQDLDAPGTSAPTVLGDLVYVVARNSRAWALDVNSGRIQWEVDGIASIANFGGGAGVAVNGDIAVFPFPSGEVIGTFPQGGLRRWSSVVAGSRLGRAASVVSDIAADPVIADGRAYVGNFGGQLVALDLADGEQIWSTSEGALGPVWPAGNALFFVNDLNELVRLDAANGQPVWRVSLPTYTEVKAAKRRGQFTHYGPVLAGGRLIVASTDGNIRQFDPASGALVGSVPIAGGAASAPAIANGVLYVVSKTGQLLAFR